MSALFDGRDRRTVGQLPRRIRRFAARIEAKPSGIGHFPALVFLMATVAYGVIAGGHVQELSNAALVAAGLGIHEIKMTGEAETSEREILDQLQVKNVSLLTYDPIAARDRLAKLPWITHATVRKLYPNKLSVEVEERQPYALWQNGGAISIIDRNGLKIMDFDGRPHAGLPFLVGPEANLEAGPFRETLDDFPSIAERTKAAVLVAGRRWDLVLDNGITVKLPETGIEQAMAQLVKLQEDHQLLSRDIVIVDLRLPDRVAVRLPQGRDIKDLEKQNPNVKPYKLARAH
ncbi:cell division protein FtsQ/DivIB [Faunimonas pinastri]|uniref:cell division protein FtsQ/DivIB n=1 Tax=Faunimonas pinastri TaxID=1855383 RepID=UPI000B83A0F7|nr:cell division protein FtsQ/DivIB [Faunimonas pinastri]